MIKYNFLLIFSLIATLLSGCTGGSGGSDAKSPTVSQTPKPPSKIDVFSSESQVLVSFDAPISNPPETIYSITAILTDETTLSSQVLLKLKLGSATQCPKTVTVDSNKSPVVINGLQPGCTYKIGVSARVVNGPSSSIVSGGSSSTLTSSAPSLSVSTSGNKNITILTSTYPAPVGTSIVGYQSVYWKVFDCSANLAKFPDDVFKGDSSDSTLIRVSGLENGVSYGLASVVLLKNKTSGETSGVVSRATCGMPVTTIPGPPEKLSATAGDGMVSLSFKQPSDDGGLAVTNYEINYCALSDFSPLGCDKPSVISGAFNATGDTNAVVASLLNGVDYVFYVNSKNSKGYSVTKSFGISGIDDNSDGSVNISNNITVASPIKSYTVTYDSNIPAVDNKSLSVPFDNSTYTVLKFISVKESISYPGRVFQGWSLSKDGSGVVYKQGDSFYPSGDNGNIVLYAKWSIQLFKVTYSLGARVNIGIGGSAPVDTSTHTYGESVTALACSFTDGLNRFSGWMINGDPTKIIGANEKFTMGTSDVNLVAKWIPTYQVSYDGNGAPQAPPGDNNNYAHGESFTAKDHELLSNGDYPFKGWNTKPDGSGSHYGVGDKITVYDSNVILYAEWNKGTVNGNGSGASGSNTTEVIPAPKGQLSIPVINSITPKVLAASINFDSSPKPGEIIFSYTIYINDIPVWTDFSASGNVNIFGLQKDQEYSFSISSSGLKIGGDGVLDSPRSIASVVKPLYVKRLVGDCFVMNTDENFCGNTVNLPQKFDIGGPLKSLIKISGDSESGSLGYSKCALLENGYVKCWGDNGKGQLGVSLVTSKSTSPLLTLTGVKEIYQISDYSICAVLFSGGVECWGTAKKYFLHPEVRTKIDHLLSISRNPIACPRNEDESLFGYHEIAIPGEHVFTDSYLPIIPTPQGFSGRFGWRFFGSYGPPSKFKDDFGDCELRPVSTSLEEEETSGPKLVSGLVNIDYLMVGRGIICAHSKSEITKCWGENDLYTYRGPIRMEDVSGGDTGVFYDINEYDGLPDSPRIYGTTLDVMHASIVDSIDPSTGQYGLPKVNVIGGYHVFDLKVGGLYFGDIGLGSSASSISRDGKCILSNETLSCGLIGVDVGTVVDNRLTNVTANFQGVSSIVSDNARTYAGMTDGSVVEVVTSVPPMSFNGWNIEAGGFVALTKKPIGKFDKGIKVLLDQNCAILTDGSFGCIYNGSPEMNDLGSDGAIDSQGGRILLNTGRMIPSSYDELGLSAGKSFQDVYLTP